MKYYIAICLPIIIIITVAHQKINYNFDDLVSCSKANVIS